MAYVELHPFSNGQTYMGCVQLSQICSPVLLSLDLWGQSSNGSQDPSGNLTKNQLWLSEDSLYLLDFSNGSFVT